MNKIFTISYKQPFLESLHHHIKSDLEAIDYTRLCILTPDKATEIELKNIFKNDTDSSCYLPRIISLSDVDQLSKTFQLELTFRNSIKENLLVDYNFLKFINTISYISNNEKLLIIKDLKILFSELFQGNKKLSDLDLNSLGKSYEERIFKRIISDFIQYIEQNNLKECDYVNNFREINVISQISNNISNKHHDFQLILIGSSFSLKITQILASEICKLNNSIIYLPDFDDLNIDLDNNFAKSLKINAVKIPVKESRQSIVSCNIFESEHDEVEFIAQKKYSNEKLNIISNSSSLRTKLINKFYPEFLSDDILLQKKLIKFFFAKHIDNFDFFIAENFKDISIQDYIHKEEIKKQFDVFYKFKTLNKFDEKLLFSDKLQILLNLIKSYSIKINKIIILALEMAQNISNETKDIAYDVDIIDLLFSNISPDNLSINYLSFSYESKLFAKGDVLISGLDKDGFVNKQNYNYISQEFLHNNELRTDKDFYKLAISDLLIILSINNAELTLTKNTNSEIMPIIHYLAAQNKLKFCYQQKMLKAKRSYDNYAILEDKITKLSVSDFNLFIKNPYGFYVKKILKLSNIQNLYKSSLRREYGLIIHKVIEIYSKNNSLKNKSEKLNFLQIKYQELIAKSDARELFSLLECKVTNLFNWWINENELINQNSLVTKIEEKVSALIHPNIELTAIIDRLELFEADDFKLIDYKTSKLPTQSDIGTGVYSQLILEALIIIKSNNLKTNNALDPLLVQLIGDKDLVQNKILEIENFANNLNEFEKVIINILDILLQKGIKLYNYPSKCSSEQFSDYIHITRNGN